MTKETAFRIAGGALVGLVLGFLLCKCFMPMINPCNWPDHCDPPARVTLCQILEWATEDHSQQRVSDEDFERIQARIPQCLSPHAQDEHGTHVCDIPDVCGQLQRIHETATQAHDPQTPPPQARKLWSTCADELEQFPGER